ncbi:MAG TPA: 1-deoxy-D-xylulose-5-phosphate reductoisomerase [bacterium]|nr:1-deoxy-D-xylulose-5-phosphate reductoisomerase [bacterium]
MVKRVSILGCTGSIGRNALDVVASLGDDVEVVGLAAGHNARLLVEQARAFRPAAVGLSDERQAAVLEPLSADGVRVYVGKDAAAAIATLPSAELVVAAMAGFAGLAPTLAALEAGKDVALANKESLVAGGHLVRAAQRASGTCIFPVDSEHAALSQCLAGCPPGSVKRLILTASGGPFLGKSREEVANATPQQAIAHPVWDMGAKISVDSATLMNKGLEVIEAYWLFDMPWDRIDVLIHPQSVVHSLVEMADGSFLAQLATADMRLPIQYALTYPDRRTVSFPATALELAAIGRLDFARPDPAQFPCFELALAAGRAGGLKPAVLNAADEVAVEKFLASEIPFGALAEVIETTLAEAPDGEIGGYEDVAAADLWARRRAAEAAAAVASRT